MKISNSPAPSLSPKVAEVRQNASTRGKPAEPPGGGGDQVHVSSRGAELAQLAAQLGGVEGASDARVAEVKAEMESGSSPLDIRALAETILQEEGL